MWGMKLQGVILRNGMLASIFTCSIAQNDKGVVNISGLNEELTRVLQPFPILGQVLASLYGDEIYEPAECISRRDNDNEALKYFYKRMNKGRIDIEHRFGLDSNLWKCLNVKHTWHILKDKSHIHRQYFSIFFMTNVWTCMNENKTSVKYKLHAPSLQEYLNVTENDWYDGDDKDDLMIQFLQTGN